MSPHFRRYEKVFLRYIFTAMHTQHVLLSGTGEGTTTSKNLAMERQARSESAAESSTMGWIPESESHHHSSLVDHRRPMTGPVHHISIHAKTNGSLISGHTVAMQITRNVAYSATF